MSPRWYYGWNVVATGMTIQGISFGLTVYTFGLWVTPLSQEFGADRGEIMIGYTLLSVVIGALSPFAGRAMDQRSIRAIIIAGGVLMALGFLLASLAPSVWVFIAIYAVLVSMGMLLAGPLPAATLAAKWFRARRGLAIGWSSVGTSIGGLTLPHLAAFLLVNMGMGWRGAHQVLAAVILLAIVPLVWAVVANTPEDKGIEPEPDRPTTTGAPVTHASWRYGEIIRDRTFWAAAIALGLLILVFSGVQSNLIPYAQDHGFSTASAATLMSLLAGAGILGKVTCGVLADRVSHRLIFWAAAAILAIPMVLMMGKPDYALMVGISLLLGFTTGGLLPLMGAIVGHRFGPLAFGKVMGLLGPFTMPLAVLGPPFAGFVYDETGSYVRALEIFLVVIVVSCAVMVFLDERPRQSADT